MGRGMVLAWVFGLGLLGWRTARVSRKPVSPGSLAAASGVFVLLAALAAWQPAERMAVLMAWGFDLSLILKPGVLPGTDKPAPEGGGPVHGKGKG